MTESELAERVAVVVTANPDVAGLHGGEYNALATYLPGRRLTGVRVGAAGEPVEVGVVLHPYRPIPEVVAALRAQLAGVCAGRAVDIVVADLDTTGVEPVSGAAGTRP